MPFLGKEEIENRFGFHKGIIEGPNATLPKHAELRRKFVEFAEYLDRALPDGGRPKVLVFTELETASMWAHKSIAETAPIVPE